MMVCDSYGRSFYGFSCGFNDQSKCGHNGDYSDKRLVGGDGIYGMDWLARQGSAAAVDSTNRLIGFGKIIPCVPWQR
jgi:hypothetical protein